MAISKSTRKLIESGDTGGLEDVWLARLAEDPDNLDFFVGTARALAGQGGQEPAGLLLEVLADQLRESGRLETLLALLERAGRLWIAEPAELHARILDTVRALHGDSPLFAELVDKVGLERAIEDIPKTWTKVARLRDLIRFEVGAIVAMEGKGAGRIADVNFSLDSIRVDLPGLPGLMVGFRAAPKMLTVLPEGHLERLKVEDPEAAARLADAEPGELLGRILADADAPMPAAAIRKAVAGIVPAKGWTAWWNAARRHPQLLTEGRGPRQSYRWAASGADARSAIDEAFDAADGRGKLEIYRRQAARGGNLPAAMTEALARAGEAAADYDPELSVAVWTSLERGGVLPSEAGWSPAGLVRASDNPIDLLSAVGDRVPRELLLRTVRSERDDWPAVYRAWLEREAEPRLLDLLAAELGEAEPEALSAFVDAVMARPRAYPEAFVWLVESGDDGPLSGRNPMRLLSLLSAAAGDRAFASLRTRLKPAWLPGGLAFSLLERVEPKRAKAARDTLRQAPVDEHVRDTLLARLEILFADLRETESQHLYATEASIEARRRELKELLEVDIPANRRALQEARELGDLSENFEYKSARQRHEYLSARVAHLDRDLRRVRAIDLGGGPVDSASIGSRVVLADEGGERREVTLLGPWESDPERDVLSYDSEVGRSLLGRKVGERVEVFGGELEIERIEPLTPGAAGS